MNQIFNQLSVIVPFAPNDYFWKDLLQDLKYLQKNSEIILVGPKAPDPEMLTKARENVTAQVRYAASGLGRGVQLNAGAKSALNNYFWFLHADTKVPRPSLFYLARTFEEKPNMLHFFSLQYLSDGPKIAELSSIITNFYTTYFGVPTGHQGFAMSRAVFYKVGGFSESTLAGEDHLFVWQARRRKVQVHHIKATLFTSARRFESEGWAQTIKNNLVTTVKYNSLGCLVLWRQKIIENNLLTSSKSQSK